MNISDTFFLNYNDLYYNLYYVGGMLVLLISNIILQFVKLNFRDFYFMFALVFSRFNGIWFIHLKYRIMVFIENNLSCFMVNYVV